MDERKTIIKELVNKKRFFAETRNRILEGFGESLLQKILQKKNENEKFPEFAKDGPGAILDEYQKLQNDIDESTSAINSLELDIIRLKELDEKISSNEKEQALKKDEIEKVYIRFGVILLNAPASSDFAGLLKQQEEILLTRIDEHEKLQRELEEHKGGVFSWFGKNAKVAVEKGIISKSKSDLQKLYRKTGEDYFSTGKVEIPEGEAAEDAKKAYELKGLLSYLVEDMTQLKEERRKIGGGPINIDGSPSQRIQKHQKHITQVKKEFPALHLRLGLLAADAGGKEVFASFISDEDSDILKKADTLASQIEEEELNIKKLNAAITIDKEKAAIDKMGKSIAAQRQKIIEAEQAINSLEKQIAGSEQTILDLENFIKEDSASTNV